MTELEQEFKKQYKQEKWDEMFKDIIDYKKFCQHNLLPSTFKKTFEFIFKERYTLKIKHIEVYWWLHKPFLSMPFKLFHYILIGWQDGKVTKLYCYNTSFTDDFKLTEDLQKYILTHGGYLHKSTEED